MLKCAPRLFCWTPNDGWAVSINWRESRARTRYYTVSMFMRRKRLPRRVIVLAPIRIRAGKGLSILLATGAVAALAVPATAQEVPGGRLIQVGSTSMRLGPFRVHSNPSYAGAIAAFGDATSCRLVRGSATWAVTTWANLQLRAELVTYGGMPAGETGCTAPDAIHISTLRVSGQQWYTSLGLRVGQPVARLKRLYPRATATRPVGRWYGRGYWLVTHRTVCLGVCDTRYVTAPRLVAEVRNGRVSAFVLVVGAQGE